MKRRRINLRNAERNTMKHQSARSVARNTPPKQKMSVGNSKRTKTPALPTGNNEKHLKVRGAHGNRNVATRKSATE